MFRCESCGSGYSAQASSSWVSCPRCLAKDGTKVPLSFELGWRRQAREAEARVGATKLAPTRSAPDAAAATG